MRGVSRGSRHRWQHRHGKPAPITVVLAGNPNVGKSTIFSRLAKKQTMTGNYPGVTVSSEEAWREVAGRGIRFIDLPGLYSFSGISEEQSEARRSLLALGPDVVIVTLDAGNLSRNLYLALELLELDLPVVVALNLVDEARKRGIEVNVDRFSELLGTVVVPTVAVKGYGLDQLLETAVQFGTRRKARREGRFMYSAPLERSISRLQELLGEEMEGPPSFLSLRGLALLLLEGDYEAVREITGLPAEAPVFHAAQNIRSHLARLLGNDPGIIVAQERFARARAIAQEVETKSIRSQRLSERIWHYTTTPLWGSLILAVVLGAVFATLLTVGDFLARALTSLWEGLVSPVLSGAVHSLAGEGLVAHTLLWALDAGVLSALAVGIPYILTFYILLGLLEDTGYLNSVAFLTDRMMRAVGLDGRAAISFAAAFGCNVPAAMSTRLLPTSKEKIIACTMVTLVPCSARLAIIIGAVGHYVGWKAALAIFFAQGLLAVATGGVLARVIPGQPFGLVAEMFPFRLPTLKVTLEKTWMRFKEYIFLALPLIVIGSGVLGLMYETGWIWGLVHLLEPLVVGAMGLPAISGIALALGVLRKEMAIQFLLILAMTQSADITSLAHFMTAKQLIVYTAVTLIYVPCLATIATLLRELGGKKTLAIILGTGLLALGVGTLLNFVLPG